MHSLAIILFALGGSTAARMRTMSASARSGSLIGTLFSSGFDMKTRWGNLRPYTDLIGFGIDRGFPVWCELSQVHGA